MMRKQLTAATLGLCGILALSGCARFATLPGSQSTQSGATTATNAERVKASAATIVNKVVGTGSVVPANTANVAFQTSGQVIAVAVRVGDKVKAGQMLALLDDSDLTLSAKSAWANYISAQAAYSATLQGLNAAEMTRLRAALNSAQAACTNLFAGPTAMSIAQAQADFSSAQAAVKLAQAAYDRRERREYEVGASQEALTLEQNTIAFNKAKAVYDALFNKPMAAEVANALAQIQTARADLSAVEPITATVIQKLAALDQANIAWQQANKKVQNARLVAPIDGMITAVNVSLGDTANMSAVAFQIADVSMPIFELLIDEADLGALKIGQSAQVQLQTYPDLKIPATVAFISPIGVNNGSVVNYTVKLVIKPDAKTPNIYLNMSGTSQVVTSKVVNAVVVPNRALTANTVSKEYSVTRLNSDNTTETIPVLIGQRGSDNTQVISGINAGDTLIVTNSASSQNTAPPGGARPGD